MSQLKSKLKGSRKLSFEEKFEQVLANKIISGKNCCWDQTWKNKNTKGYVDIYWNGGNKKLHRMSYAYFNNLDFLSLNPKISIHHTCANRWCFRPDHLEPVSVRENVLEMLERKALKAEIVRKEKFYKELKEELNSLKKKTE